MPNRLRRLLRVIAILAAVDGIWELGMSLLGATVSWWDYLTCWALVGAFTAAGYHQGHKDGHPTRTPNPGAANPPDGQQL